MVPYVEAGIDFTVQLKKKKVFFSLVFSLMNLDSDIFYQIPFY